MTEASRTIKGHKKVSCDGNIARFVFRQAAIALFIVLDLMNGILLIHVVIENMYLIFLFQKFVTNGKLLLFTSFPFELFYSQL